MIFVPHHAIHPIDVPLRLARNCWNWDLNEFARRCNLDPDSADCRALFKQMNAASAALNRFPRDLLPIIMQDCPDPEPPKAA